MICVVIKGPTFQDAQQQILKALEHASLVELRLDCLQSFDLAALKELRAQFPVPMIFTLRSQAQGGYYLGSEEERLDHIRLIASLKPDYLDLENHIPPHFIKEISGQYPEIKLILSYHNFTETPEDLEGLYQDMQKTPAFFYKIAVFANNCLDAMRLICWAKKSDGKLIAISMGSHGQISRILAPKIRCPITYAALEEDQKSAPGQLSAKALIERYHHHSMNPHTILYGLIGHPVDQSISDESHNNFISTLGIDAVYVKISVSPEELSPFLQLAKQLSFDGLSVTMPLKEQILPYLDDINPEASAIGAVNTLHFEGSKICGFNTDGIGALNAIEDYFSIKDKRIVIIGAGGAARAIAYEAKRRGGHVTILNRDKEKALKIAQLLHCAGNDLDSLKPELGYDVLINCTPSSMPIDPRYILLNTVVMDITTKPKETAFLKAAQEKGCFIVYGFQMFFEQAFDQFNIWLKSNFDIQSCKKTLEDSIKDCFHQ